MRHLWPLGLLLALFACDASAPVQDEPSSPLLELSTSLKPVYAKLYEAYDQYREPAITHQRFKHADVEPLLTQLEAPFELQQLGESIEGRAIYELSIGDGPVPVLLWSQMHGDEPTATMALLDIFRFFQAKGDGFDSLRTQLLSKLSLYFIPLLNPDGAEVFKRRNALDIDLNRDALRLQSPEAKLLKAARDRTKAVWGFNLHDQNRYYAAGDQPAPASVSFLAPAFNAEKGINEGRGNAMRLIVLMNEILQGHIPNQIGRYDDTFEPRAFGDNMQKWGTNTILIESGGLKDDPEKQELRKLHFVILLSAFEAIASGHYEGVPIEAYERIPFNNSNTFHDLLIRGASLERQGQSYFIDLAFRHRENAFNNHRDDYPQASISDVGDLSTAQGYEEIDAEGFRIVPGRTYEQPIADIAALRKLDLTRLLLQGYTYYQVKERPHRSVYAEWPIDLIAPGGKPSTAIQLYGNPAFLLEKNGEYRYAVVNGFAHDLKGRLQFD